MKRLIFLFAVPTGPRLGSISSPLPMGLSDYLPWILQAWFFKMLVSAYKTIK
jgi:hypothetical protein